MSAPAAQAAIGNGRTAPSHDRSSAVIPICNPISTVRWLKVNFGDHGRDLIHYRVSTSTPSDVIRYSLADTRFHIPATLRAAGGFADAKKYCTNAYAPRHGK